MQRQKKKRRAGARSRSLIMALEPRILFDAGGVASAAEGVAAADAPAGHADAAPVVHGTAEHSTQALVAALADYAPPAGGEAHASSGKEIVFIAPDVPDAGALIAGMTDGADVVMLRAGEDAVAQMTAALAGRDGVSAVHIISHGEPGILALGSNTLSLENLDAYSAEIGAWSQALTAQADILIYGCDVAAGARGAAFIGRLAALTDADVAASIDHTGAASKGGDWDLERATGAIEARLAVNHAARDNYSSVFAQPAAGFGKALAFDGANPNIARKRRAKPL